MSRTTLKIVKGATPESQIKSIDSILESLNRKPQQRWVIKSLSRAPMMVELKEAGVNYNVGLLGIVGVLSDFVVYINNSSGKNVTIVIRLETVNGVVTENMKVKDGFSTPSNKIEIKHPSLISFSYTVEAGATSTPPIIGFTFQHTPKDKDLENVSIDTTQS